MTTITIPRTSSDLVQISRAEQRKQRLLELETEQAAEEAEALKMTEEQRQILLKSFTSVKVEFTDLDGLCWSQAALPMFPPPSRTSISHIPSTSNHNAFVVLTNADLANFSAEDTIRVSASANKLRPRYPGLHPTTPQLTTIRPQSPRRHRDCSRSRSPIKGLFQSESPHQNSEPFMHPINLPYFPPSDSSDGNVVPTVDSHLVTKPKQGIVSRGRRKLVGPHGLLPMDSSTSQTVSTPPKVADPFQERITQWQKASSIAVTHDFVSGSTVFAPKNPLYHSPVSPVLSKSPLVVHSFVSEPPREVNSPQHARVRLHSILNGTIPSKPVPFPVEPDITPSPFLLSSSTFGNGDSDFASDFSEDDETPTASPTRETGGDWIR